MTTSYFTAAFFLLLVSTHGHAESGRSCSAGVSASNRGEYAIAHIHWKLLASDGSQKAWLKATRECLFGSKLADSDEAVVAWLHQAANQDDSDALTQLALMYFAGVGVQKDVEKSKELLRAAKTRGNEAAAFLIEKIEQGKPPE